MGDSGFNVDTNAFFSAGIGITYGVGVAFYGTPTGIFDWIMCLGIGAFGGMMLGFGFFTLAFFLSMWATFFNDKERTDEDKPTWIMWLIGTLVVTFFIGLSLGEKVKKIEKHDEYKKAYEELKTEYYRQRQK